MSTTFSPLLVHTTAGPILGYKDTFYLTDQSTAPEVFQGKDGSHPPVAKWLGIPYAESERWKQSHDPSPWEEPLECYDFGPRFPSPEDRNGAVLFGNHGVASRSERLPISEDKAFVTNVFAPGDVKAGEKLPVLAWIHGGGLMFGNSGDLVYDPTVLIRHQAERGRRVIIVTANYRLNVFGFLASKDLIEEANGRAIGNYGLYDCVTWLRWLQDNITAFGGDPTNVTVYGESAGSFLCNMLCLHPAPLFKRAILQSGAVSTMQPISVARADTIYRSLLTFHNITPDSHPTVASRLAALRALPFDVLCKAYGALPPMAARLTIEHGSGAIYTEHPIASIRMGKLNKEVQSILVGTMGNEGALFELVCPSPVHEYFLGSYPPDIAQDVRRHYLGNVDEEETSIKKKWKDVSAATFIGNCTFYTPVDELAEVLTEVGVNVYRYSLDTTIERIDSDIHVGPCHSISLPFLFDVDLLWDGKAGSPEGKTAKNVSDMVCRFASDGHINSEWMKWEPDQPQAWIFTPEGGQICKAIDIKDKDKALWREVYSRLASRLRVNESGRIPLL